MPVKPGMNRQWAWNIPKNDRRGYLFLDGIAFLNDMAQV